jgi:UDP-N-acetylmuramate dehydrogenase
MIKKSDLFKKEKVSLKKYSTFFIGGDANYLIKIKNEEELIETIKKIKKNNFNFHLFGGGSNVLFSDKNLDKIFLKIEIDGIFVFKNNILKVKSGTSLSRLVSFCLEHGLTGLEWANGIPGTVGGAVRGNAGAFQESIKDSIVNVVVYDTKKEKKITLTKKDCKFEYRDSLFKSNPNYIIIETKLKLKKSDVNSIKEKMTYFLEKRKEKQPFNFSAGSVFKNYKIKNEKEKKLIFKKYPEIEKITKNNFIPTAFLIERCGLKQKKIGGAMISEKHANFIINFNKANASDVKKLINIIKKEVKKKFKINIEEEIFIF